MSRRFFYYIGPFAIAYFDSRDIGSTYCNIAG